jgi:hypothetical protein
MKIDDAISLLRDLAESGSVDMPYYSVSRNGPQAAAVLLAELDRREAVIRGQRDELWRKLSDLQLGIITREQWQRQTDKLAKGE